MKKLLIGLLALMNSFAFSGEIENRKTGETILIEHYSDTNIVSLVANLTDRTIKKEISTYSYEGGSADYSKMLEMSNKRLNEVQAFESLRGLHKGVKENGMNTQAWVFGLPVVAVATGIDILSLPVTLPIELSRKLSHNSMFKRDKKIIGSAITSNEIRKVSKSRFKRLLIYMGLNKKN